VAALGFSVTDLDDDPKASSASDQLSALFNV